MCNPVYNPTQPTWKHGPWGTQSGNAVARPKGHVPVQIGRREMKAQRMVEALKLRQKGHTYLQIARDLGFSQSLAEQYIKEALKRLSEEQAEVTEHYRALEISRLDDLYAKAYEVLEAQHYLVSAGNLVYRDGEELLDDTPVLRAIDRLLRISERRARLLNLDLQSDDDTLRGGPPTLVINFPPEPPTDPPETPTDGG